jgi:hypothetical protein
MIPNLPNAALPLGVSITSPGRIFAQRPYFQYYRWKSLWIKSTDLSIARPGSRQMARPMPIPSAMQAVYCQYYTENSPAFGAFRPANSSNHSSWPLLHSSQAKGRLRVTSDGICRFVPASGLVLFNPFPGQRIVPLTRPIRRTILAEITREAAGDGPRKFFRESR